MLEWYDLNARHEATFLWAAVVLLSFVAKSSRARSQTLHLLRALLKPSIFLLIIGLVANVVALSSIAVIIGRKVGLWETLPIVAAIIWSFTTGVFILLHLRDFLTSGSGFRTRAASLLGPSTIITEVVGIAILAFWLELLLIPVLFLLVFEAYSKRSARRLIVSNGLLLVYATGLIASVVIDLIADPGTWRSLAQAILFPVVLTIGILPYMKLLVMVERLRFIASAKCKAVTASEYGIDWPLTVDSAKLCSKSNVVWVEVKGRKYGVSGNARTILENHGHECLELNDIWGDHPERDQWKDAMGTDGDAMVWKVSVGRLIQDGLALERQS